MRIMRRGQCRPDGKGLSPGIPIIATLTVWLFVCAGISQAWDRAAAEAALNRACELRQQLTTDPSAASREDYLKCIHSYRRVYFSDPHFHGSDDAIYGEAVLYQEMAARFRSPGDLAEAVRLLRFLVKDYGVSPYRRDALNRLAALEPTTAPDVRPLKTVQVVQPGPVTHAPARAQEMSPQSRSNASLQAKRISTVRSIRHWSTYERTRMVIDLDGRVLYRKEMISNPDRLFFDLADTVLTQEHAGRSIVVGDRVLKKIRVGQNRPDVARIVLDLEKDVDCTVRELEDPFRIVVEIRRAGNKAAPLAASGVSRGMAPAPVSPPPPRAATAPDHSRDQAPNQPAVRTGRAVQPQAEAAPGSQSATPLSAAARVNGSGKIGERNGQQAAPSPGPAASTAAVTMPSNGPAKVTDSADALASAPKVTLALEEMLQPNLPKIKLDIRDTPAPVSPRRAAAQKTADAATPSRPVDIPSPAKMASPTSGGNMTMTRVLGLKVTRIVIDPGHGGSDTGTVGRNGLKEKDLVLDVARELKESLEERIGAIVVMTRNDDRFVSLEERTAIANRNKADLFISIHANSSTSRSISGIETYYLHFARSWSERVVAARENAATVQSISELEDLIRKIVLADKSSESRELAGILQKSLYSGTRTIFPEMRNRGVRRAPFLVLVGAEMPAVLVEVAFLSNPRDEQMLSEQSGQQIVARALLSGIEGYVKTLSNFVAEAHPGSK
ncbi:MAG: N-acetylmuramoyl-L-alanine amidase [Acidobacteria bacterium]|nr:N-acetylmuramoyl-L-alanine amidase [Acidobacteriota bacterium]